MNNDLISRQDAIDALWKALYEYEDKTEKQFIESDELDVGDWIEHRIFVQNMNDIDRQMILNLPSAQPKQECEKCIFKPFKQFQPDLSDVVEVKHGEWQRHYSRQNVYADLFWHCSICGYKNDEQFANKYHNYCPHCGAKMDLKGNE